MHLKGSLFALSRRILMTIMKSILLTTLFAAACLVASGTENLFAQRQNMTDDAKPSVVVLLLCGMASLAMLNRR